MSKQQEIYDAITTWIKYKHNKYASGIQDFLEMLENIPRKEILESWEKYDTDEFSITKCILEYYFDSGKEIKDQYGVIPYIYTKNWEHEYVTTFEKIEMIQLYKRYDLIDSKISIEIIYQLENDKDFSKAEFIKYTVTDEVIKSLLDSMNFDAIVKVIELEKADLFIKERVSSMVHEYVKNIKIDQYILATKQKNVEIDFHVKLKNEFNIQENCINAIEQLYSNNNIPDKINRLEILYNQEKIEEKKEFISYTIVKCNLDITKRFISKFESYVEKYPKHIVSYLILQNIKGSSLFIRVLLEKKLITKKLRKTWVKSFIEAI